MHKQELGLRLIEECKTLKDMIEKSFIVLAEKLKQIRDERLYAPIHESFWSFLQEDLKMSESQASRMITTYEKLILGMGFTPKEILEIGGWNEAYLIAKHAKNKKDAQLLMEKSALMPPTEFRKEIAEYKSGEHKHNWEEVHFRQCKICFIREKIFKDND